MVSESFLISETKSKPAHKFIVPPINYLGETWAGGIVGLAYGTNISKAGVFNGLIVVSNNGLSLQDSDLPRVGGGVVAGVYNRVPDLIFDWFGNSLLEILDGVALTLNGVNVFLDTPSAVSADTLFVESGVRILAVDGALVGGLFGLVEANSPNPSIKKTEKQPEQKTVQERAYSPSLYISNAYSKASISISQTTYSLKSSISGIVGYLNDCEYNLKNIVSSANLQIPTDGAASTEQIIDSATTTCIALAMQNVYYDKSLYTYNEFSTTPGGELPTQLLGIISTWPSPWQVTLGNYGFDFQGNLPLNPPKNEFPGDK